MLLQWLNNLLNITLLRLTRKLPQTLQETNRPFYSFHGADAVPVVVAKFDNTHEKNRTATRFFRSLT